MASCRAWIVTDEVQVVGDSGLACYLQGMSGTRSPNLGGVVISEVVRDREVEKALWARDSSLVKNLNI